MGQNFNRQLMCHRAATVTRHVRTDEVASHFVIGMRAGIAAFHPNSVPEVEEAMGGAAEVQRNLGRQIDRHAVLVSYLSRLDEEQRAPGDLAVGRAFRGDAVQTDVTVTRIPAETHPLLRIGIGELIQGLRAMGEQYCPLGVRHGEPRLRFAKSNMLARRQEECRAARGNGVLLRSALELPSGDVLFCYPQIAYFDPGEVVAAGSVGEEFGDSDDGFILLRRGYGGRGRMRG